MFRPSRVDGESCSSSTEGSIGVGFVASLLLVVRPGAPFVASLPRKDNVDNPFSLQTGGPRALDDSRRSRECVSARCSAISSLGVVYE